MWHFSDLVSRFPFVVDVCTYLVPTIYNTIRSRQRKHWKRGSSVSKLAIIDVTMAIVGRYVEYTFKKPYIAGLVI
jgi:hypothetical protein